MWGTVGHPAKAIASGTRHVIWRDVFVIPERWYPQSITWIAVRIRSWTVRWNASASRLGGSSWLVSWLCRKVNRCNLTRRIVRRVENWCDIYASPQQTQRISTSRHR